MLNVMMKIFFRSQLNQFCSSRHSQDSDHVPTLPSQITIERDSNEDVSDPKHGKEDPDNMPHVGGNTWAGGTGW